MFHTVTAVEPSPITSPAARARSPVNTTITALTRSISPTTAVTARRTGSVFQIGRPSGTS
jgi:hypothetical protein